MTVVLKLGGSLVTDKARPETLDEAALDACAAALGDAALDDLVLVHGGGSFGHHRADRHGLSQSAGSRDARAVFDVHDAMCRLSDALVDRLHRQAVPALPVRPLSSAVRDDEAALSLSTDAAAAMLAEGFVPVLHGDVIVHAGAGATIVSGDELVVALAEALAADRVGLCGRVPGVLDEAGAVVPEITDYDAVSAALGGSDATDVTGGMAAKVRTLLALDAPAAVFGLDDLPAFLAGELPGTRLL